MKPDPGGFDQNHQAVNQPGSGFEVVFAVGAVLDVEQPPMIDRMRIAYMVVAMRDPNPVHVEEAAAAEAGLPGTIAHGTFVLSYLGAAVSRLVGVDALHSLDVKLTAPVFVGEQLRISATVLEADGARRRVAVQARNPSGATVARGTVDVEVPA